jgi:S-adenosylmethionine hydrolase
LIVSDCTDVAFAEMRGAIIKSATAAAMTADPVIEALVPVREMSILNASFLLRLMADAYDTDTLLMFVVNSVQIRPERIVGITGQGHLFEGANTGALGWLARDMGVASLYELDDPGFVPFGGKFVHAPAVGRILAGVPISDLGTAMDPAALRSTLPVEGQIVHIDNFGNGKFRSTQKWELGQALTVTIGGTPLSVVYGERMMDHSDGTWVVYPGSSLDLMEIGEVRGPGLIPLRIAPGEIVELHASGRGLADPATEREVPVMKSRALRSTAGSAGRIRV